MTTELANPNIESPLAAVEAELSSIIETLIHLGVQVHDFQGTEEAKIGLSNNINKLISQLQSISSKKDLQDISIPLEIVNYIEDGRNPDIYTREFVDVVRKINQYLYGKSIAFQEFRDILSAKIKSEFPDLEQEVESIRLKTNVKDVSS
ncbi:hypothetical protein KL905_000138 [Ogataea polymorpha]|uniref:Mediator of RNA polymerase II transcription subunit 10 n=1 Tax=Ogataea polymorpha TaxID=460523 RepID=A0A9P8P0T1_9ASCO|nr:hypothetical protein KL908_001251 [Ogataea polymorpha]KAG7902616.1 hypothetical protein KL935_001524 [Ogataea polymorpha]KAG7911396.1 hypothetical protein KL906_000717 [Ogataea polymorpha]KAG7912771.1 hypothetical protein KL907_000973 [Ogataea polymorpha]KAG7919385.1 hypothetical protein KL927_001514 [Ogataea polymorpha]